MWSRRAAASPRCACRPASRTSMPTAPGVGVELASFVPWSALRRLRAQGPSRSITEAVIGADRARLVRRGFAQALSRQQRRRQSAGEAVPEQAAPAAARPRHRPSRSAQPTSAVARRAAQDVQRDRAIVGGLQEDLGLALARQRSGNVEGAADAGDSRRRSAAVDSRRISRSRAAVSGVKGIWASGAISLSSAGRSAGLLASTRYSVRPRMRAARPRASLGRSTR